MGVRIRRSTMPASTANTATYIVSSTTAHIAGIINAETIFSQWTVEFERL